MSINETAPQFIWKSLLKNPNVIAESTGTVNEYKAPKYQKVDDTHCWMCAGETHGSGILVADRITEMFSDVHHMKCPESKSLCEACYGLQSQRRFRFYSTLATASGIRHLARSDWVETLIHPPDPPWAALLAVSGQKHLFFKTLVNHQNNRVAVQFEELTVNFSPHELESLIAVVERMYLIFTKVEIESGRYDSRRILQYGFNAFEQDDQFLARYRGGRLLSLAVWIARKDEEKREEVLAQFEQQRKEAVAKKIDEKRDIPVLETPENQQQQLSLF